MLGNREQRYDFNRVWWLFLTFLSYNESLFQFSDVSSPQENIRERDGGYRPTMSSFRLLFSQSHPRHRIAWTFASILSVVASPNTPSILRAIFLHLVYRAVPVRQCLT